MPTYPISKVIWFPYKPHMACNLLSIWTFHMVAIYFCTRHPRWNPYGNAIWLLYRYHVASRWRIHMVSRSKPHEYRGPCGYYRPTYVQQNKTQPILSDESSRTDEAAAATQPFILLRVHRKQSSICPVNICLHCICYNYPKIYKQFTFWTRRYRAWQIIYRKFIQKVTSKLGWTSAYTRKLNLWSCSLIKMNFKSTLLYSHSYFYSIIPSQSLSASIFAVCNEFCIGSQGFPSSCSFRPILLLSRELMNSIDTCPSHIAVTSENL